MSVRNSDAMFPHILWHTLSLFCCELKLDYKADWTFQACNIFTSFFLISWHNCLSTWIEQSHKCHVFCCFFFTALSVNHMLWHYFRCPRVVCMNKYLLSNKSFFWPSYNEFTITFKACQKCEPVSNYDPQLKEIHKFVQNMLLVKFKRAFKEKTLCPNKKVIIL